MPELNLKNATKLFLGETEIIKVFNKNQLLYSYDYGDPYGDNVVLYLKGNGDNNSTNIVDSSPNPKTITRFGDTKISTAQSKYGGSSIFFNGNTDFLTSPANSIWHIHNTLCTIEGFVYLSAFPDDTAFKGYFFIVGTQDPSVHNGWGISVDKSGKLLWSNNGVSTSPTISSIPLNKWTHFAFVNLGATGQFYIDGIQQPIVNTAHTNNLNILKIGALNNTSGYLYRLNGYLDSLRITGGISRYTANFNPETDTYLAY